MQVAAVWTMGRELTGFVTREIEVHPTPARALPRALEHFRRALADLELNLYILAVIGEECQAHLGTVQLCRIGQSVAHLLGE